MTIVSEHAEAQHIEQRAPLLLFLKFIYSEKATKFCEIFPLLLTTLASGINVGPTFINFGFFSRPYSLIREYIKVI